MCADKRYGELVASVMSQIESVRGAVVEGASRHDLLAHLPAGAARNAVDCALWDLEAKICGQSVAAALAVAPRALQTAYTLSLGTPEEMARQAAANAHRPLLKIKLGADGDAQRMRAVAKGAPNSRIIVDANEGLGALTPFRNSLKSHQTITSALLNSRCHLPTMRRCATSGGQFRFAQTRVSTTGPV